MERTLVIFSQRITFCRIIARNTLVRSEIVKQLEAAFQSDELDELKESILPFITKNREKLLRFVQEFQRIDGPHPLDMIIKIFIIQHNMPFNMAHYLARQSSTIRMEMNVQEEHEFAERQSLVANWIRQKAAAHRSTFMFEQVFCFERLKGDLMPLIEDILNLQPVN